jgi:hypothetical protein
MRSHIAAERILDENFSASRIETRESAVTLSIKNRSSTKETAELASAAVSKANPLANVRDAIRVPNPVLIRNFHPSSRGEHRCGQARAVRSERVGGRGM